MALSSRILMLFDNTNANYVSRLYSGASKQAASSAIKVQMENVHGTDLKPENLLDAPDIGGIILTAPLCDDRHVMLQVEKRGLPYARTASMLDPGRGITVIMDEFEAALQVTKVMLDAGHRRVGIIRGPRSHLASMRRYNGFAAALGTKGVKLDQSLVVEGDFTKASGAEAGAKLIANGPTAIFASNDSMALGLSEAARGKGISMPQQLSLVGFDDDPFAKTMNPPLTSIRQPLEEMGATAYRMLADHMAGQRPAIAHAEVPFELVERASVAPPAA